LPLAPVAAATALLAYRAIATVLQRVGHPGAALDDAYIHFQYARAIAEGHPLRFEAGAPITSGSTSMLWPLVLAPFWALGARGEAILWPAWGLSFAALGALAYEVSRLTERLAGRTAAMGAGVMTLCFGGFTWCAASGMEVMPFAWAIARASRSAAEWAEAHATDARSRLHACELVALAWLCALLRPEGGVAALFVAATLALFPRAKRAPDRAVSLAAGAAPAAVPALLWAVTGTPQTTTAVAKLLPGNPYYVGAALTSKVATQAKTLVDTLLDGDAWAAEFVPHGGAAIALTGLAAVAVLGVRSKTPWRAAAVLALALTMFAPCFYLTFLWNRLRYLWPFASGWIIGLACLARLVGDLLGALRLGGRIATGILCGAFAGLFASKLEWVIDDVAQSASGIDRQQAWLGRWAKEHLPRAARIGVNDTGAIAYFGDHDTFDIVGLTTRGEARYWVAGVGSRLEHYERMRAAELPTHFIVYPQWMALDSVLGEPLTEAVVTDATILGGTAMRAYVADWSKLGSGERPWSHAGDVLDALDVADLESESEHHYELLGAGDGEQVVIDGENPAGDSVIDGGRTRRTRERFIARVPQGVSARGIVRIQGPPQAVISIMADGSPADRLVLDDSGSGEWVERAFDLPPSRGPQTRIELRVEHGPVSVFHYWFFAR
jgi:hypothetical protein